MANGTVQLWVYAGQPFSEDALNKCKELGYTVTDEMKITGQIIKTVQIPTADFLENFSECPKGSHDYVSHKLCKPDGSPYVCCIINGQGTINVFL